MSPELIVAVLASLGLGTIGGAIVAAISNRRRLNADTGKLGAEATKIIQEAASGVVVDLQKSIARKEVEWAEEREEAHAALVAERAAGLVVLEERAAENKALRDAWQRERDDVYRVLQLHVAFDQLAIAKLAEEGIEMPPPPPLLPPLRSELI